MNNLPSNPNGPLSLQWSASLAYAIGLIASDGYLSKTSHRIGFTSKEREMIDLFRKTLSITNKVGYKARGGELDKKYMYVEFKNKEFYQFLIEIGLTPAKSKTIQSVTVPEIYFADFFRGLLDGDGTFWTAWDKRWPNSFLYHVAIYSASKPFLEWLQNKLTFLYEIKGHIKYGASVYEIRYAKTDSRKIFEIIYYNSQIPFLTRKYLKIKEALDFDQKIKQNAHTPR